MRPSVFYVFLVRPSKYDDEGFVIHHWRAVVPSNSLACLYGLTEDVRQRRALGEVDLRIYVVDEAVDKMPSERIFRLNRRTGERVLVCLVGVQTNQVCRAAKPHRSIGSWTILPTVRSASSYQTRSVHGKARSFELWHQDCSRGCPFNIQALLDVVPILNVTNDPAITKFAADIPAKLVSNSAVVLRDAEKIRKTTMAAAEDIMAKMNAYLA